MSPPGLLLVRHGQTTWNATHRFQGQHDVPLDDVGVAQAAALADRLRESTFEPVGILSSDLSRATATAAPLAALYGLPVATDQRLREIGLGAWEGMSARDAAVAFPEEHAAWRVGHDVRRGGGETYGEVAVRAGEAVRSALPAYPSGLLIVVTHGGTARALAGSLIGLPQAAWSALGPLGNCRLGLIGQDADRWRLLQWNGDSMSSSGFLTREPLPVGAVGDDR